MTGESESMSSGSSKYNCCKTKIFTNFICTKCFSVFHKSCLLRDKSGISFLIENEIICCKKDSDWTDKDQELSILEKTVSDLFEDNELKNCHIQKQKKRI